MTSHPKTIADVQCHTCGRLVPGRRALAFHKEKECMPNAVDKPEPCRCFTGKHVVYASDGTVHQGHTYGLCAQHEGDAW